MRCGPAMGKSNLFRYNHSPVFALFAFKFELLSLLVTGR
jgi:hypothetical protein